MEINSNGSFQGTIFSWYTQKVLDILNPTIKVLVQMIFLLQMGDV